MQGNKPFKLFTLQWHITNNCKLRCKHCYVDFSKSTSVSMSNFKKSLNNYKNFLSNYWIKWKVYFTWWDPLLHNNIWDIIDLTKENWLDISLFWNFHLLTDQNIKKLVYNNIKFYQLSMEWLKDTNDDIRWIWTFDWVLDAIERLENNWIYTLVNVTLSKMNIDQIIPLMEYLAYNTNLSRFDFVRVVPMWKASRDIMISDQELKNLFIEVIKLEWKIKNDWKKMVIWKKDHLWKLLYHQSDRLKLDLEDKAHGCWMWYRHLTVLENGDIYLCRKLPIKLWNIVTDDLTDLYNNSNIIRKIMNIDFIEWCKWCELYKVCRWCPAVTYWLNWNLANKDPQCWL